MPILVFKKKDVNGSKSIENDQDKIITKGSRSGIFFYFHKVKFLIFIENVFKKIREIDLFDFTSFFTKMSSISVLTLL